MTVYPVQLEVSSPPRFERIQLVIRLAIGIALGVLGVTAGWLSWLLFLVLPIIAAVAISTKGAQHYLDTTSEKLWPALGWLFSFEAYMLLISDRVPVEESAVKLELHPSGNPTIGSALLRVIMSIPSALALCVLGCVSCILWWVSLFSILFRERVPPSIVSWQTGFLRWQARLAAYHASLVEEYPPFSFGERSTPLPTAMVKP
jgi:hypothetical protein